MPKMVRFREVGGPEVLRIEEEPIKQPGKGEVRLKVQAVGLNRAELMFMRDQYVEHPELPGGLGYEAAGLVEAVAPQSPTPVSASLAVCDWLMIGDIT
jgi:NADPH:quinone reductase-like Zn-dependent oxidoreductase